MIIGIITYRIRNGIKKKFSYENIIKWLSVSNRMEKVSHTFIVVFITFIILFYIIYYTGLLDIINFSIIVFGILLIEYTIYYFCINRKELFSIAFFVIIAVCVFLIFITFNLEIMTGMKISEMNIDTAKYYHTLVSDIILGFSAVVGIGLTLIYEEKRSSWRKQVSLMFGCLMLYFIYVMYMVFLRILIQHIADLNKVIV